MIKCHYISLTNTYRQIWLNLTKIGPRRDRFQDGFQGCYVPVFNLIEGHCRLYPQTFFMLNFSKTGQGKENISQDKNFTEILFDVNL